MTTKTTPKTTEPKRQPDSPTPELLKAAYEIHTLTQMIYTELAVTRPWLAHTLPIRVGMPAGEPRAPWTPLRETPWTPQMSGHY